MARCGNRFIILVAVAVCCSFAVANAPQSAWVCPGSWERGNLLSDASVCK